MDRLIGHANQWFWYGLTELSRRGAPVSARGRTTREFLHVLTQLPEPRKRVLTVPFRRANPFFQAAEPIWILMGDAGSDWIVHYNSQLTKFLDESQFFHGAYGERLRRYGMNKRLDQWLTQVDQLQDIVIQLEQDPGSRRAVAVLHNPAFDNPLTQTNDRPCNIALSVQQRDGALHAALFNRSNDYVLGLTFTNLVQFTTILETLAASLWLETGTYSHLSSSLHLYDDDPISARLLGYKGLVFDVYDHVEPTPMELTSWKEMNKTIKALYARTEKPVHCPYWRSIQLMLLAWDALKKELLGIAMMHLAQMPAHDWQVAALEYVHRWANRRGLLKQFEDALLPPNFLLPDACTQYILHDKGDVA